jgi:hypothetical protein
MRTGSLGAAAEQTGHSYDTIGLWMRRLSAHTDAVTEILEREEGLSASEIDTFWSLVGRNGQRSLRRGSTEFLWPIPSDGDVST